MEKKPKDEFNTREKISRANGKGNEASDDCGQIDDIIGGFGKYQFMIFMFKILIGATSAFNNLGVTFFAPSDFISFWCTDTTTLASSASTLSPSTTTLSPNISTMYNLNATLSYDMQRGSAYAEKPKIETFLQKETLDIPTYGDVNSQHGIRQLLGEFMFSSERKYKHSLNLNSDTPRNLRKECTYRSPIDDADHKCTSYEYNTGIWISTIIDEWDLVCDRAWFISVTQSLYMAGFIISYLVFGYISDRFGRWNSLLLGAVIEISSGFGCAYSSSIAQFMLFRFLLGLGNAGRSSSSYLIMIEWTGIRWRMHISTLGSLGWILGYCMMPWIVLFFLHFRHMQLFVCFYEIIFLIWLLRLPESPRWLLTHRRFNEAYDVLMMAAKFNGLILKNEDKTRDGENNLATTSSTGNLVMDEYSTSSHGSDSLNYATALSHFSAPPIAPSNDGERARAQPPPPQTGEGNVDREAAIARDCEMKQRKSSLVAAGEKGTQPPPATPESIRATRTDGANFLATLCGPCTNWFCGEGQARELLPYTEDEFDSKFKRLTNIVEAKEFTKNEDKLSILDLFKWNNLRKYTFILAFAWAVNSFIYYGIALRVGDFGGKNLFVAFTFAGATELPSVAFTMVCMKMLPRRTTNLFLFSTILLLCVLQVPLRYYDCQWLQQMTMMLAKLFNSCSFTCILYQTMELFPTSIRQTAYSSCSLAGRVGSILAPFIKELSQMTSALVPPIIYAVLTILEILFIKHLPETQGADLPDTLLEAEKFKGTDKVNKIENTIEVAEKGEINKSKRFA